MILNEYVQFTVTFSANKFAVHREGLEGKRLEAILLTFWSATVCNMAESPVVRVAVWPDSRPPYAESRDVVTSQLL